MSYNPMDDEPYARSHSSTKRLQIPSVFVGKQNYPSIPVGLLSTQHDNHHDDPKHWFSEKYKKSVITSLRSELTNASQIMPSVTTRNKFIEQAQHITLSNKTVECDVSVENQFDWKKMVSQGEAIPYGSRADLTTLDIVSHPSGDKQLEKVYYDTDCNATTALSELYKKQVDEHTLMRMLSIGTMGVGMRRKIVPTRWSITAVDDSLSKKTITEIAGFDTMPCSAYTADYLGNYFLILCFEDTFKYEFLEILPDKKTVKTDYELVHGRKHYAYNTAGGYYACRFPVCEHLLSKRKQGTVLVLRYISPEYNSSLGVWVLRQTVREAFSKPPLVFSDRKLLLTFASAYISKKWGMDAAHILGSSEVLPLLSTQSTLKDWF